MWDFDSPDLLAEGYTFQNGAIVPVVSSTWDLRKKAARAMRLTFIALGLLVTMLLFRPASAKDVSWSTNDPTGGWWTSSNPEIFSVDPLGNIKRIAPGKATICVQPSVNTRSKPNCKTIE